MKRMSFTSTAVAFCFITSSLFVGAIASEICVEQQSDAASSSSTIGGFYTYNVTYEVVRSLDKQIFRAKKQLEQELESFVNVFKNEMALLIADYEQLPFRFSEDKPLIYITLGIIMEEEPENGYLYPRNQGSFNVAIDAERALTEFATEYVAFSGKARVIILAGCQRIIQLLKQYEDALVFESGKPALVLDISLHLDRETIEKLVSEKN